MQFVSSGNKLDGDFLFRVVFPELKVQKFMFCMQVSVAMSFLRPSKKTAKITKKYQF